MQRAGNPYKLAKNVVGICRYSVSKIENVDKPKKIVYDSPTSQGGLKKDTITTSEEKKRINERTEKMHQRNKESTATEPGEKTDYQSTAKECPGGDNQGGQVKVDKPPIKTPDIGRYSKRPQDF